ncbi:MAG: MBL fold metallo-hydrolase, partial [Gammaproteobacteria bacterium]|nr:MBL fold metallo-hydrolase [Gammaproteobacteria bacterium]
MRRTAAAILLALLTSTSGATGDNHCNGPGVHLQVLGSGGPIADDSRSSAAYLLWHDGRSRIMVDAGGGAFVRFGEAGADFEALDHVAISHFHTDHSADFITLLKTGYFSERTRPLGVSGPGAGGPFPSLDGYLARLIGVDGAYAYLGGYLDGSDGLVRLDAVTVDPASHSAVPVYESRTGDILVTGRGVPHGIVPTIAYRVSLDGRSVVFASDQNGNDESFAAFARDADVLVMHMVVPEDVTGAGRALHAPPGRIGEIAAAAGAKSLVLSHLMARSLEDLAGNVALVQRQYGG